MPFEPLSYEKYCLTYCCKIVFLHFRNKNGLSTARIYCARWLCREGVLPRLRGHSLTQLTGRTTPTRHDFQRATTTNQLRLLHHVLHHARGSRTTERCCMLEACGVCCISYSISFLLIFCKTDLVNQRLGLGSPLGLIRSSFASSFFFEKGYSSANCPRDQYLLLH